MTRSPEQPDRPARGVVSEGEAGGLRVLLLSAASGSMDILSFWHLGQVFTSAMTGNAALLGLYLGQGDILAASRNIAAFLGFLAGLGLGALVLRRAAGKPGWSSAVTHSVLIEAMLLVAFGLLWGAHPEPSAEVTYGLIGLSAIAMGAQSAAGSQVGLPGVTSTYFTGTLTRIVTDALGAGAPAPVMRRWSHRRRWPMLAFLAYIGAAAATSLLIGLEALLIRLPGSTLTIPAGLALPWLPAAAIGLALFCTLTLAAWRLLARLIRGRAEVP